MNKENNLVNKYGNVNSNSNAYGNHSNYINDKNINENYFTRSMLPSITPEVNNKYLLN